MHPEARHFTIFVKNILPSFFENKKVLDVGSGDINGNNRFLFTNCIYEGNDVIDAENVTIVSRTKDIPIEDNIFDTIISTECFEHDPDFNCSIKKIYKLLKPGGLFLFSCAGYGRPEHGTRKKGAQYSYGTIAEIEDMQDYYCNITENILNNAIDIKASFVMWDLYYNNISKDLYFLGIKRDNINNSHTITNLPKYIQENVICTSSIIL